MSVTGDRPAALPPHNAAAERSVLSSLMASPEFVGEIKAMLSADDFYLHAHAVIYRTLLAMHADGVPFGVILVAERILRGGRLDEIGGIETLLEIAETEPHGAHAVYYAEIVREVAEMRRIMFGSRAVAEAALERRQSPSELRAALAELLVGDFELNDWIDEAHVGAIIKRGTEQPVEDDSDRFPTGFESIDKALGGGFRRGQLVVVGARASVGKTAWCGQIGLKAARAGHSVAMLSFEMSDREMLARFFSQSGWDIADECDAGQMAELRLRSHQATGWTIDRIESEAKRLLAKDGLDVLIVDYLGLIAKANDRDNELQHLTAVTGRLKQLALSLGIVVLLAAQFNRAKEGRDDSRPKMTDFRGSGTIEQDADVLIGLHREVAADNSDLTSEAKLYLMKNRSGPTAELALTFVGERFKFGERSWSSDFEGVGNGF